MSPTTPPPPTTPTTVPAVKEHDLEGEREVTLDGSVDIHGNPAVRSKTGNWKACPFILG